jgi:hypothetical protein
MRELGALTKNGNTLGVRSFYTTSICQRENSQGKYVNIALDDIQNLSGLIVYCHAILHMYCTVLPVGVLYLCAIL